MNDLAQLPEWSMPAGTMVHLNGIPYCLKSDSVLLGVNNPDHFKMDGSVSVPAAACASMPGMMGSASMR